MQTNSVKSPTADEDDRTSADRTPGDPLRELTVNQYLSAGLVSHNGS